MNSSPLKTETSANVFLLFPYQFILLYEWHINRVRKPKEKNKKLSFLTLCLCHTNSHIEFKNHDSLTD